MKYWRPQRPGGPQWRWILYDTDFGSGIWNGRAFRKNTLGFALEANGPNWPNPPWSTLFLRKLVTNDTFRHRFINRFADEMNSRFLPNAVVARINENADRIASEIPRAVERWGKDYFWAGQVERMREFYTRRPEFVKSSILEEFDLEAYHTATVSIADTNRGYVELNSLTLSGPEWSGDYFEGVPIRLKAVAKSGYVFDHWEGGVTSDSAEIAGEPGPGVQLPTRLPIRVDIGIRADRPTTGA